MTHIAVLWHHHQPDYRDPSRGRPVMPWTRLHALRGYRDLATALLETGCPMTVNLVPSLLDQLIWYAEGGDDPHLALTRQEAASLTPAQRAELLRTFVGGHPAMWEARSASQDLRRRWMAGELQRTQDLLDLQVWSTLAWVGWSARRADPLFDALIEKGQGFTEDDKAAMLRACESMVAEVLPLHRRLVEAGQAEITASAYYHPILPLLIDAEHARRSTASTLGVELPEFRWPQDAALQLARGRARVEALTGAEVRGLWPSEGSVSPELLPLAAEAGFRWLVSDVGNLRRSERERKGADLPLGPWDLGHGLRGFFRDTSLSDAIGFRYAQRPPVPAAGELLFESRKQRPLSVIALDGENPWECYPDAGEGFMLALCEMLMSGRITEPVTFSEACERLEPVGRVTRLHSGSWIASDFNIWIGDDEDRAGWRVLAEAREAVAEAGDPPEALEHVLAAEGSDWFWWYGKEFTTPFALEFDRLFRGRVAAAWRALGQDPPEHLQLPIKQLAAAEHPDMQPPVGAISPPVDARAADLFAWAGAGIVDCARPGGAMAHGVIHLRAILWGLDEAQLYLRLVHAVDVVEAPGTAWLLVLVDGEARRTLRWAVGEAPEGGATSGAVTDLALPRPSAENAHFHLALVRDGAEVARYPRDGAVPLRSGASWWV
ncbi:MAG: hypothetical protein H6741_03400 [Alphaproteobacteria bacterium]|nr:hypothetical protein [Alphaproteobacteria bacterium]